MATSLVFVPQLTVAGWFDPTATAGGWFDETFATTGASNLKTGTTSVTVSPTTAAAGSVTKPQTATGTTVTLTTAASGSVAKFGSTVSDLTPRTNLCTDPSINTGTIWASAHISTAPWTFGPVGIFGNSVFRIWIQTSTPDTNIANTLFTFPSTGTYTVSMYFRNNEGVASGTTMPAGTTVSLGAEGGTAVIGSTTNVVPATLSKEWSRSSATFNVTTAGTAYLVWRLGSATSGMGSMAQVFADGCLIEAGSTLQPYFDGSQVDGFSYSSLGWNGTADASTSTVVPVQSVKPTTSAAPGAVAKSDSAAPVVIDPSPVQVCLNQDFESSIDWWTSTWPATITGPDATQAHTGTKSMKVTCDDNSIDEFGAEMVVSANASPRITATAWVRGGIGTNQTLTFFSWDTYTDVHVTGSTTWQEISIDITGPLGGGSYPVRIIQSGVCNIGDTFYIDDVSILDWSWVLSTAASGTVVPGPAVAQNVTVSPTTSASGSVTRSQSATATTDTPSTAASGTTTHLASATGVTVSPATTVVASPIADQATADVVVSPTVTSVPSAITKTQAATGVTVSPATTAAGTVSKSTTASVTISPISAADGTRVITADALPTQVTLDSLDEHITNGTFETDTSGWSNPNLESLTRDTSQFHSGSASMHVVNTAGGGVSNQPSYRITLNDYNISFPYVSLRISAWVKADQVTSTDFVYLSVQQIGGNGQGTRQATSAPGSIQWTAAANGWYHLTWICPNFYGADGLVYDVLINASTSNGGDSFWVDDVSVIEPYYGTLWSSGYAILDAKATASGTTVSPTTAAAGDVIPGAVTWYGDDAVTITPTVTAAGLVDHRGDAATTVSPASTATAGAISRSQAATGTTVTPTGSILSSASKSASAATQLGGSGSTTRRDAALILPRDDFTDVFSDTYIPATFDTTSIPSTATITSWQVIADFNRVSGTDPDAHAYIEYLPDSAFSAGVLLATPDTSAHSITFTYRPATWWATNLIYTFHVSASASGDITARLSDFRLVVVYDLAGITTTAVVGPKTSFGAAAVTITPTTTVVPSPIVDQSTVNVTITPTTTAAGVTTHLATASDTLVSPIPAVVPLPITDTATADATVTPTTTAVAGGTAKSSTAADTITPTVTSVPSAMVKSASADLVITPSTTAAGATTKPQAATDTTVSPTPTATLGAKTSTSTASLTVDPATTAVGVSVGTGTGTAFLTITPTTTAAADAIPRSSDATGISVSPTTAAAGTVTKPQVATGITASPSSAAAATVTHPATATQTVVSPTTTAVPTPITDTASVTITVSPSATAAAAPIVDVADAAITVSPTALATPAAMVKTASASVTAVTPATQAIAGGSGQDSLTITPTTAASGFVTRSATASTTVSPAPSTVVPLREAMAALAFTVSLATNAGGAKTAMGQASALVTALSDANAIYQALASANTTVSPTPLAQCGADWTSTAELVIAVTAAANARTRRPERWGTLRI